MPQEQMRNFGIPALDHFVTHCHLRRFPSKAAVVNAGDSSSSLFLVIEGSVAVVVEDEDGNEIVVAYLNRGEFFGEMGLFQDDPTRTAWVRTRSECLIAEISYTRFRELAHHDPDLLFALSGQLAARLKLTTRKVSDLAFLDVTGRIARTLLDLCREPDAMTHPDGMQIRISRQEIGRIVGCSREMAGRVLKTLEEQGLVSVAGKTIVVFGAEATGDRTIPLTRRFKHR
ncbi:MAG TPA: cAMP-activated global transcriptional regulator CRP [Gammaproteobacteria bacterium]|nr:cAMP-activated global transcriptional regulator CRP [Gammaproteobacteria bacterium]